METNSGKKQEQKKKIRERYKGVDPDMLEVIPARIKTVDFYDDEPRRVAVYVRVSTDDPRQTSSYELQKNYYEDLVNRHENWSLVEIYADEGISGTSLKHRDSFNRMIVDCRQGKIDMIITKSVSRFARNIVDCISIVRDLGKLKPAVGVFFETENIFTLKNDSEMGLSFQATMAQEESHVKSNIMNASLEMRFSHGIVLTPVLLGYDHDENGELVINPEEAKTVRLIFFMYLYGYSPKEIAEVLTDLGCITKKGNTTWTSGSVVQQLRNERHCGDVLTRKTFTESYLDHKSSKNNGERTQHRWRDHHEAIVSHDDFIAVQHMLDNARPGSGGFLPQLQVIHDGILTGFVSVNPRWAGFTVPDYVSASQSVCNSSFAVLPDEVHAEDGEFDLRGFQVARAQFFDVPGKLLMSFSGRKLSFNQSCLGKMANTEYIEFLVQPITHIVAVRAVTKDNRNALKWLRTAGDGKKVPREISAMAFSETLFELFGWNIRYKYRLSGTRKQNGEESMLIFDAKEPEIFMPQKEVLEQMTADNSLTLPGPGELLTPAIGNSLKAYPLSWGEGFGRNYYEQMTGEEKIAPSDRENWELSAVTEGYKTSDLKVTDADRLKETIQEIIKEKKKEKERTDEPDR